LLIQRAGLGRWRRGREKTKLKKERRKRRRRQCQREMTLTRVESVSWKWQCSKRTNGLLHSLHACYILTTFFFPMALQPPMGPWPTCMKLSVSLRFS
jgi:hypothetical protein